MFDLKHRTLPNEKFRGRVLTKVAWIKSSSGGYALCVGDFMPEITLDKVHRGLFVTQHFVVEDIHTL